jgi:hypothetical protein
MATVIPPRKNLFDRATVNRRVRHPLETIRGYIRRYVLLEGIAITVLYLAICFWVWLFVDFIPWKLFSFDWLWEVQQSAGTGATVGLRTMLLGCLVLGLVAVVVFKVVRRLFREFSDPAMAMLLERRFPRQLGDRLITAVELADPELAKKYGYSQVMVDKTIQDAADEVEKLPVQQIFRWGRLLGMIATAVLGTVGLYLLCGAVCSLVNAAPPRNFFHQFNQTAGIWAERNLLMQSSYWPPNTCIELVRFPGAELRVPKEDTRPDVIVRSVKWAIADQGEQAPRGWRALRISDLENLLPEEFATLSLPADWPEWIVDLDDLDPVVANGVIPPSWQGKTSGYVRQQVGSANVMAELDRNSGGPLAREKVHYLLSWKNWTVDRLEQQLWEGDAETAAKSLEAAIRSREAEVCGLPVFAKIVSDRLPVAKKMRATHPEALAAFQELLRKLDELTDDPSMGRRLRKMRTPSEVVANRKMNDDTRGTTLCKEIGPSKFMFPLGDLKTSCTFTITANEYATPTRSITLVPPPELERLLYDKEEPAYLYYRLLENPEWLMGKWQQTRAVGVSVNGAVSKIYVPWGSSMKLTLDIDRPVNKALIADVKKAEESTGEKPDKAVITAVKDGVAYPLRHGKFQTDRMEPIAAKTLQVDLGRVTKLLEFQLEYLDDEFVKGGRHIVIVPQRDQAPFVSNSVKLAVAPRLVNNIDSTVIGLFGEKCYLITPDAFLKLRGTLEDDHGLTAIHYSWEVQELPIQKFNQKDVPTEPPPMETDPKTPKTSRDAETFVAGLQFMPGPTGYTYPYFAAAYYGGVKDAYLFLEPQMRYAAAGKAELGRAKVVLNQGEESDVAPADILRLLHLPPSHRPLLLEALNLKPGDDDARKKFLERLKAANLTDGFLREVAGFSDAGQGDATEQTSALILTDPAAALVRLLQPLAPNANVRLANKALAKRPESAPWTFFLPRRVNGYKALLAKQPESALVKKYDLRSEDAILNGFDLLLLRHGLDLEEAKDLTEFDIQQLQDGQQRRRAERRWRFLKPGSDPLAHYHLGLKLTLEIADNNLVTGPGKTKVALPYAFILVSENELLALMVADQRLHSDALVKLIDKLDEQHRSLMGKLYQYEKEGDPFFVFLPLDKTRQELAAGLTTCKQIRDGFEEMLKEMELNRMKKKRIAKLREDVLPLARAITAPDSGSFARAQEWARLAIKSVEADTDLWEKNGLKLDDKNPLRKVIDDRRPQHVKETRKVADDLQSLIAELRRLQEKIGTVITENEALEFLVEAEAAQRQIHQLLRDFEYRYREWLFGSLKTP